MSLVSCFYTVTARLAAFLLRKSDFGHHSYVTLSESSLLGNFSPVSGDKLARSISYGFADAHADDHALPEIRDSILYWHLVIYREELPSVRVENGYASAGGQCRHEHSSPAEVRRQGIALLSIAEFLDNRHE